MSLLKPCGEARGQSDTGKTKRIQTQLILSQILTNLEVLKKDWPSKNPSVSLSYSLDVVVGFRYFRYRSLQTGLRLLSFSEALAASNFTYSSSAPDKGPCYTKLSGG